MTDQIQINRSRHLPRDHRIVAVAIVPPNVSGWDRVVCDIERRLYAACHHALTTPEPCWSYLTDTEVPHLTFTPGCVVYDDALHYYSYRYVVIKGSSLHNLTLEKVNHANDSHGNTQIVFPSSEGRQ